ncbi:MAG: hypothetical protein LBK58_00730 [Prevotellaceae bacterium]|jgi:hypothetical protein|nr:hypothetical protein [Prevotellaceae bacterium]
MDEQLKTIVENLIEKTGKGEIEWTGNAGANIIARISDYTIVFSIDIFPHYTLGIHSKAGMMKLLCAKDEEWADLLHTLYSVVQEYHQRIADKALKSLAELLARPVIETPTLTAILNKEIRFTTLSCRAINGLTGGGIETVRDIVSLSDAKGLLKFRNLGFITIREVEDFISGNGLSFGMFNS